MSADEATIRRARYSLTFDDLFHVPPGWLSWRCRLWRSRVDAGYEDGACKYDHNVDSWGQLAAETAEHLTRWHPLVVASAGAGTPTEPADARRPPRLVAELDGQPGCPVERWDGPYRYRCGLGTDVCAFHGRFVVRAEPSDDTTREAPDA